MTMRKKKSAKTVWKKGQSGNPKGRPAGSPDWRNALRDHFRPKSEELIKKAIELALDGDSVALRMCLERLVPPVKISDIPTAHPLVQQAKTAKEKAEAVVNGMASGDISATQGSSLLQAIISQMRITELTELEERIVALEDLITRTHR